MENIQTFRELDQALMNCARRIKPLYYIEPTNIEEQKEKFLTGRIQNPQFTYKELEYDPKEVENELILIETPNNKLGAIFKNKKQNLFLFNRVIANRGDKDIVRKTTISIHGSPDKELVSYAGELLRKTPNILSAKTTSSRKVRDALQEGLNEHGILDWKVEFSDKNLTTVWTSEKKITVCKNRKFSEVDPNRLKVHEVGVHTLRAVNGHEQPLKIFSSGLPGYLPTEEGLASYFEEITGNSSDEVRISYAARVIAVDSVCEGLSFRQTYDRLMSYDLTTDQAWNLTIRSHRGGGYIKDHVYLEGHRRIKNFAENGGDFRELYVGKVGIDDLPLVRKLLKKGVLKKPKYLPNFLNK